MEHPKRLTIGISGASGSVLALELLKALKEIPGWETHLVISKGGVRTLEHETRVTESQLTEYATRVYDREDVGANIASGTFVTEGMVIVPCSMKTVAGVCHGYSDNLLLRAADVTIKERRKLVMIARETPLSPIHLRNMLTLSQMGVVIMPPMLTYYTHPRSVADMTNHIVGKILHEFGVEGQDFKRWGNAECVTPLRALS
ncbi:MAG: UbiX family flavin prenyltransferase [Pseudodesulfovibrio sp.]|jgi:polyprenyl P-hydroxybenzoate/phenylacrylic acid decarboxylase-like protein|uniref:UbiX family flavin prenyltransferase n=1 Tax=Pseudodesulfovibrio TaxID=2035811 RepID=UPI00292D9D26|nr:UbiX family flavin prenyltransferase [Pseudodesulfovibrio indicus]